jgi:orotidine-5'-phosphate decarboxylase
MATYEERLANKAIEVGSFLCAGIDPHFGKLPGFMRAVRDSSGEIGLLRQFSEALVDAAAGILPAVKFQSAFYEAFSWEGFRVLTESIAYARERGLLTILDAKRGDIASTMAAYGSMAFDKADVDCMTVTPYMGLDVVKSLVPWLSNGKGIYVVWVGSNTSASDFLQWKVKGSDATVAEGILDQLAEFSRAESLAGAIGLVLGATMLTHLDSTLIRRSLNFPLLLPGVGAQGGGIPAEMASALATGRHLLPQSRSIAGLGDPAAWEDLNRLASFAEYRTFIRNRVKTQARTYALC